MLRSGGAVFAAVLANRIHDGTANLCYDTSGCQDWVDAMPTCLTNWQDNCAGPPSFLSHFDEADTMLVDACPQECASQGSDLKLLITEWVLHRYTGGRTITGSPLAPNCNTPFTGVGAQQMWRKAGHEAGGWGQKSGYCFQFTSEASLSAACLDTLCTVNVFCARGGASGIKMQFHSGDDCLGPAGDIVEFAPHLTWPQVVAWLLGGETCARLPGRTGMYEKWSSSWRIGTDFPNCLGYDLSTQGEGLVTSNPEDSPMYLRFYSDSDCNNQYLPGTEGNATSDKLLEQRWMSVLRRVSFDTRSAQQKHCWDVETGADWNSDLTGSFRLTCGQLVDSRMGYQVEHYTNRECSGAEYSRREVFFMSMGYGGLNSGQKNVINVVNLLDGKCEALTEDRTGQIIYWKFDRPMYVEDWPNCHALALQENIRIDRPLMSGVYYTGGISSVRTKPGLTDNAAQHAQHPGLHTALALLVAAAAGSMAPRRM